MRTPTKDDIPAVRGAFNGTSWTPEKREQQRIDEYLNHMAAVKEEFDQWRTPENSDEMDQALEAYRAKYAQLFNAYLSAHGRVASTAITGGSNFPTRRMQKRGATSDRRMNEWLEWSKARLEKLRRQFDPRRLANAPISSDDPEAIEKLNAKIAAAEKLQETMRAANKIARSKKLTDEEKVAQLTPMIGEQAAYEILKPDFMGGVGFAAYQLTNNNANIRRMKERVVQLEAAAGRENTGEERGEIAVERNARDNRLQIFFPDKPVTAVRDALKRNGFRWSPRNGCWQRFLNDASELALERVWPVIEEHYKIEGGE